MALAGPTLLAATPSTSNAASYPSASCSPTAGALIVVAVYNTDGTNAILPTVSSAFSVVGGTWTQEATAQNSTSVIRLTTFSAVATGTPGTGAVTADFGGDAQTGCIIIVVEYTGQDGTDPVLQPQANGFPGGAGTTSRTETLAGALGAAGNQILAFIGHNTNEDQTAGGGGTELASSDVGYNSPTARLAAYSEVGDNSVSASWSTASLWMAAAMEIVEATGAGAFELDLGPGSYEVTGAVAAPVAGRVVSNDPGSYTVTGAVASPVAGRVVNAEPGAYTITGEAAGLLAARTVNLEPGAYATTGADAGTVAGRVLSGDPGVYTVIGFDADLVFGGPPGVYEINAEPGSYAITGSAAGVVASRFIDASPGVYTVTGAAATFAGTWVLNAAAGAYTVTGAQADLVHAGGEPVLEFFAQPSLSRGYRRPTLSTGYRQPSLSRGYDQPNLGG